MLYKLRMFTLMIMCLPAAILVCILSSSSALILEEYAAYPTTLVTMLLSIPSLSIIPGLMIGPGLMKKMPAKLLVLLGTVIFFLGGVLPAFVTDFYAVFGLRALMGFGCGLVLPVQATYAATYPENERATIFGLTSTVSCLIATVLVAISGFVVQNGWHNVFLLYGITIVPFVLEILLLPMNPQVREEPAKETAKQQNNLSAPNRFGEDKPMKKYAGTILIFLLLLACNYICTAMIGVELAQYMAYTGLGDSKISGIVMSTNFIGAFLGGMMMAPLVRNTNYYAMSIILGACGIGWVMLCFASSLPVVAMGCLLCGLFASMMCSVTIFLASRMLPIHVFTPISAVINLVVFGMQFVSPLVFLGVLNLVGGSFRMVFGVYGVFLLLLVPISIVLLSRNTKSHA